MEEGNYIRDTIKYIDQVVCLQNRGKNKKYALAVSDPHNQKQKECEQRSKIVVKIKEVVGAINEEVGYEIERVQSGNDKYEKMGRFSAISASKLVVLMGFLGANLSEGRLMDLWFYARSDFGKAKPEDTKIITENKHFGGVSWIDWKLHAVNYVLPMVAELQPNKGNTDDR